MGVSSGLGRSIRHIFSVTGEAVNFGGRRLETIARVAWLPMVMAMLASVVTTFAYLSVIAERPITFSDISNLREAANFLGKYAAQGFEKHPIAMWSITAGSLVLQSILVSAYMAPLIRYAGLGEKPAPGVVRLAFGPDQLRFVLTGFFSFLFVVISVLAPILVASYFSLKYIVAALKETVASFPNPESLHTIEVTTLGKSLADQGTDWVYTTFAPAVVAAPLAILFWVLMVWHFAPRKHDTHTRARPLTRIVMTLLLTALLLGGAYLYANGEIMRNVGLIVELAGERIKDIYGSPVTAVLIFGAVAYLFISYINLRLFAWPGVAVCRRSMSLGHALRVTRRWRLVELQFILIFIWILFFFMQAYVINGLLLSKVVPFVVGTLYQATAVSTKLLNSGAVADWVRPAFVWIWNGIKIGFNILWLLFSTGVVASLYGRLYRESEAAT
ncbi:MAG: hypothetical protein R3C58_00405 [Parvularculaceae bacterium]